MPGLGHHSDDRRPVALHRISPARKPKDTFGQQRSFLAQKLLGDRRELTGLAEQYIDSS